MSSVSQTPAARRSVPLRWSLAAAFAVARHRRHMMGMFYGGFAINLFVAFLPGRALWMTFFG